MTRRQSRASLARSAGVEKATVLSPANEIVWIEVIQKMESVYADLVETQVQIEQKNAALEEAQQFIRSVLVSMTDVLIVCDLHGRILQVNRALEGLTGKQETELMGQPLVSLFTVESGVNIDSFSEKPDRDELVDCEVGLLAQHGDVVPLAINCSHRYDADGSLVGTVLIGRSVGELQRAYKNLNKAHGDLKQTQMQLVHSEKMASLGRLVAGVAHELNNPISFVFGNIHALQNYGERINCYLTAVDGDSNPDSLRQLRDKLRIGDIMSDMDSLIEGTLEGAERVRDIVQDLRRYSTAQKESVASYDLTEIVRTAAQWVIKACRVKPEISYDMPDTLQLEGCKGHVHQIMINLVQNAVDMMEDQKHSRMTITCRIDELHAVITVHDNGPGIPDQAITKLFDPFYTTKPVGKGTGLGLSISYGLAVDMGGELKAGNHARGGAIFTLDLPLKGEGYD